MTGTDHTSASQNLIALERQLELLKKENHNLKQVFEGGSVGYWTYTNGAGTFHASKSLADMLDINQTSFPIVAKNLIPHIHPNDYTKSRSDFLKMVAGHCDSFESEFRIKTKSGAYSWFFNKGKVIEKDKQGKPVFMSGLLFDIKDKKIAEEKAHLLNRKYETIFNQTNDAIAINKITPSGPGEFIEVNQAALHTFGYSLDELKKINPTQLLGNSAQSKIEKNWQLILEQKQLIFETKLRTKSNQLKHVELNCVISEIANEPILLSVIRDITDRVETQKELVKARVKAEESDKLKSAFLANMSHEIRTPMNAIAGFSSLLIQDDIDTYTKKEYVNIINTNTNLLLRLITDIVDLSKIESGLLKIIPKTININRLIKNLYKIFSTEIKRLNKSHIKLISTNELADNQAILITDAARLSQILNNLLYNAIKYTDKGFIEYGYTIEDESIVFFVKDSGIGIVTDKQDVIFKDFRQANEVISEKNHGGTGLGLSISKKLVELLGGRIWVESERYVGSTFYFTLPFVASKNIEAQEIQNTNQDKHIDWSGKTLLLVEYAEDTINLISIILFETKVNILVARTGEEALHLCTSNPKIDLILMDIKLPDIHGIEASESLRHLRPDINIIAQTTYPEKLDTNRIQQVGIQDILYKPFSEKILIDTLKKYLN